MPLELTPKDRIFLANQYKILAALYPQEAESYDHLREAVESGYAPHYDDGAQWLECEMSAEECREVIDILQMFSDLAYNYRELSDKSGINEYDVRFRGFDGNNETSYMGYADYFINKLGRFQDLKDSGDGLNSHGPFLEAYRRMLQVWRPLKSAGKLRKEQIQEILSAAVHPSNRK